MEQEQMHSLRVQFPEEEVHVYTVYGITEKQYRKKLKDLVKEFNMKLLRVVNLTASGGINGPLHIWEGVRIHSQQKQES